MENLGYNKKFRWEIKDFLSLQTERFCSAPILIGDCKWRLVATYGDYLSLYLEATGLESLPCGRRTYTDFRLTIVNRFNERLSSIHRGGGHWFDKNYPSSGFPDMISVVNLTAIHGGFLMDGVLMIIAQVVALEVISTLNVSQVEEINDDSEWGAHDYSSSSEDLQNKEDVIVEVKGFQVLDSQVRNIPKAQVTPPMIKRHVADLKKKKKR